MNAMLLNHALRLLAQREHSEQELRRKLAAQFVSAATPPMTRARLPTRGVAPSARRPNRRCNLVAVNGRLLPRPLPLN